MYPPLEVGVSGTLGCDGIVFGVPARIVWPTKLNTLPYFETSVTSHASAQCHLSEDLDVCLTYHKPHFAYHGCNVAATGSWSNNTGHRNSLSKGQLGAGISVFIAMSTSTLGNTQFFSSRYREHSPPSQNDRSLKMITISQSATRSKLVATCIASPLCTPRHDEERSHSRTCA